MINIISSISFMAHDNIPATVYDIILFAEQILALYVCRQREQTDTVQYIYYSSYHMHRGTWL